MTYFVLKTDDLKRLKCASVDIAGLIERRELQLILSTLQKIITNNKNHIIVRCVVCAN
jgi:hypothetical protein